MGGGYVLNFSDRTFAQFFAEELNIDIDERSMRGTEPPRAIVYAGFVTPASARWALADALAKGHEEDQLRGISVPA
jgi:hypothetical protein